MQNLEAFLARASDLVWGPPLLILLVGTHLFLTVRLRFIQRYLPQAIKLSFSREKEGEGDVSQFGALTTALAATIGTGNIVGVSTAVAAGGPGAVLWMWLTGVFGIATKYAEAVLAVKYRIKAADGSMAGGPMYALERGLGSKALGIALRVAHRHRSLRHRLHDPGQLDLDDGARDLRRLALDHRQRDGGAHRRRHPRWHQVDCQRVRKARAVHGGVLRAGVPDPDRDAHRAAALHAGPIFTAAFTGQAAVGGFLGAGVREAMRFGVARGLFSNESGLGSAPIVAAAAQTKNPVRQALVSSTGTFWDTVVVCAMTGIVVVNSGGWQAGPRRRRPHQAGVRGPAGHRPDRADHRPADVRVLDHPRLGLLRRTGRRIPVRPARSRCPIAASGSSR